MIMHLKHCVGVSIYVEFFENNNEHEHSFAFAVLGNTTSLIQTIPELQMLASRDTVAIGLVFAKL